MSDITFMQRFFDEDLDDKLLTGIYGPFHTYHFDEEEDRLAETWLVWVGYKDGKKFTITHKRSGWRYDGPKELFDFVDKRIKLEKIRQCLQKSC